PGPDGSATSIITWTASPPRPTTTVVSSYDANDNQLSVTAALPGGAVQTTRYLYGVAGGTSDLQGHTVPEIAADTKRSLATVKRLLHQVKQKLGNDLGNV